MSQMPDKIWINPLIDLPKLSGHIDKDSVQYVRKDAFIEKACEWFKSHGSFTIGFDGATVRDFLNFINK